MQKLKHRNLNSKISKQEASSDSKTMNNSSKKQEGWNLPSSLEEWEQMLRSQSENSETSETQNTEQQELTNKYEVRFVNMPK